MWACVVVMLFAVSYRFMLSLIWELELVSLVWELEVFENCRTYWFILPLVWEWELGRLN